MTAPRQLVLNLTADEAFDSLTDVLAVDEEIEGYEREIAAAKEHIKERKLDLKDAVKRRAAYSRQIRDAAREADGGDDAAPVSAGNGKPASARPARRPAVARDAAAASVAIRGAM